MSLIHLDPALRRLGPAVARSTDERQNIHNFDAMYRPRLRYLLIDTLRGLPSRFGGHEGRKQPEDQLSKAAKRLRVLLRSCAAMR